MARQAYRPIVQKFVKLMHAEGIVFEKLILFGSYAKGLARENSDVDLCVVFRGLRQKKLAENQLALCLLAGRNGLNIDVIVTSVTALTRNQLSPILHEIRTYGVELINVAQSNLKLKI